MTFNRTFGPGAREGTDALASDSECAGRPKEYGIIPRGNPRTRLHATAATVSEARTRPGHCEELRMNSELYTSKHFIGERAALVTPRGLS
jgi:hypothetical protein